MSTRLISSAMIGLVALALPGCEPAAGLGDEALNRASFNRIQATPFMDQVDAKARRASLDQAFGFPRSSLSVESGVQVTQAYSCDGSRVIANVSLKNLTAYPKYCAAFTEIQETGTDVGPHGVTMFEYDFAETRSFSCFDIS